MPEFRQGLSALGQQHVGEVCFHQLLFYQTANSTTWSAQWVSLAARSGCAVLPTQQPSSAEKTRTRRYAHTTHRLLLHRDMADEVGSSSRSRGWQFPLRFQAGTLSLSDPRASTLPALQFSLVYLPVSLTYISAERRLLHLLLLRCLSVTPCEHTHAQSGRGCSVRRARPLPGPIQAVTSICMPKKSFPLEAFSAFSWSSCCRKNTSPYRSSEAP